MFRTALLVAPILAGLAFVGWRISDKMGSSTGRKRRVEREVSIEIAEVRHASISDVRPFFGSMDAGSYVEIAAKTGGRLERLHVDIGDIVTHGKEIAVLDSDEYRLAVDQASAELNVARSNSLQAKSARQNARSEFDRVKQLRDKGIASKAQFEQAESVLRVEDARFEMANAEVARRQAALRAAEVRRDYTTIFALWKGGAGTRVVGERFVDEGAMLTANKPIVSILDVHNLKATIEVIEEDYPDIEKGQSAVITTGAFPNKQFTGTVERVAPLLKKTSRQARVEIDVPNPSGELRPGMFIRAEITFASRDRAQIVPRNALVARPPHEGVFKVDRQAGVVHFVAVTKGIELKDRVEILEPVLDMPVATVGRSKLADGTRIQIDEGNGDESP